MQLKGFTCSGCNILFALEDDGEPGYIEALLRGSFPCPRCSKENVQATLGMGDFSEVVSLGPRALWAYLNGLGLPKEIADWKTVEGLLLKNRVLAVGFDHDANISVGRCVIDRLLLDNGKTLHFAASGAGAMIHMVTEEEDGRKSTELRNDSSPKGPEEHPAGSEARPAADVADDGPQGEHPH